MKYLAQASRINVDTDSMVRKRLTRYMLNSTTFLPRTSQSIKKEKCMGQFTAKGRILKTYGFYPVYYNSSTVGRALGNLKDHVSCQSDSEVYELSRSECNSIYISKAGWALVKRIDDFIEAYGHPTKHTVFAQHQFELVHNLLESSYTLIHSEISC